MNEFLDNLENKLAINDSSSSTRLIPEPTRSLLWITNEDPSKARSPMGLEIRIGINGIDKDNPEDEIYSEPSMIWAKLPISPNNQLEQLPMYYPAYTSFTPEVRYQYLSWLTDVTKQTNLSFVFLYFYGLERHLLVGNYDGAVDEILRLLKYHTKKSFSFYATRSLIVASIIRGRPDIINKAPYILTEEIDEALALRIMLGTPILAEDIITMSSRVGFTNKNYLKKYPEIYKLKLQSLIDKFEQENGRLLSIFKLENFKKAPFNEFANLSILTKIREIPVPQILENKNFKSVMLKLLTLANEETKEELKLHKNEKEIVAIGTTVVGKCPYCKGDLTREIKKKSKCPICNNEIFVSKGKLLTHDAKIIEEIRAKTSYLEINIPETIDSTDKLVVMMNDEAIQSLNQKNFDKVSTIYLELGIISFELKQYEKCLYYYLLCSHYSGENYMITNPVKESIKAINRNNITEKNLALLACSDSLSLNSKQDTFKKLIEDTNYHFNMDNVVVVSEKKYENTPQPKESNYQPSKKGVKSKYIVLIILVLFLGSCFFCCLITSLSVGIFGSTSK